jgi:hypothetical protein
MADQHAVIGGETATHVTHEQVVGMWRRAKNAYATGGKVDQRNVYGGEREVRPPRAPTTSYATLDPWILDDAR